MRAQIIALVTLGFSVLCCAFDSSACQLNQYGLLHVGSLDVIRAKLSAQKGVPEKVSGKEGSVGDEQEKKVVPAGAGDKTTGDVPYDVKSLTAKYNLTWQQTNIASGYGTSDGTEAQNLDVYGMQGPLQKAEKYSVYEKTRLVSSGEEDGEGEVIIFLNALVTHSGLVIFFLIAFSLLRRWFPTVYRRPAKHSRGLTASEAGLFGWVSDSLNVKFDEVVEAEGLDDALLLEFTRVCMKLMRTLALVVFVGVGSINYIFGGMGAGKDYLDYNAFSNVQAGCWVHWVDAFSVWVVVIIVQEQLYNAQQAFLSLRFKWLRHLAEPRATSVLVEGVPDEYQTDEKFRGFFEEMFGHDKVKAAYLAKRAPLLQAAYARKELADKGLHSALFKWEKLGRDPNRRPSDGRHADLIEYWTKEDSAAKEAVKVERERAQTLANKNGGLNGCNGFVTFHNTTDAEIALSVTCGADTFDWRISNAPRPHDVIWHDLEQDPMHKQSYTVLGYVLTIGLYMIYLPCVLWSTSCAKGLEHRVFAAVLPPISVQIFISTAPTFLRWIFKHCFTMNNHGFSQELLQMWFWNFQVVFVIMVPAMGEDFWIYVVDLVTSPIKIFHVLGRTLPLQSHFFLNYAVMVWTTRVMELLRYVNLTKYLWYSRNYAPDMAKEMSEPEDRDYYGKGSRYSRMTIMINIGIIFSALCPTIIFLVMADIALCRLIYGYLIPFVETKKPDSGGHFWVKAMEHVSVGAFIYCMVMTGVLYGTASTPGPAIVSACSFPFLMYSMWRFENEFLWKQIPFHEHRAKETEEKRVHDGLYKQPEWIEEDEEPAQLDAEAEPLHESKMPLYPDPALKTSMELDPTPGADMEQDDDMEPDPMLDEEMLRLQAEVALLQARLGEAEDVPSTNFDFDFDEYIASSMTRPRSGAEEVTIGDTGSTEAGVGRQAIADESARK